MRTVLFIFLIAIGTQVHSAEFMLGGKKIVSKTSEKTVSCSGYSLKIVSEEFPYDYEDQIPYEFAIKGFYGSNVIVSMNLYFQSNESIQMPRLNDLSEIKNHVDNERTYLPTKAYCKEDKFVVHYWSGGNCKECELFVEYDAIDKQYTNPKIITYKEDQEFYN